MKCKAEQGYALIGSPSYRTTGYRTSFSSRWQLDLSKSASYEHGADMVIIPLEKGTPPDIHSSQI